MVIKTVVTKENGGSKMDKEQTVSQAIENYQDALSLNPQSGTHTNDKGEFFRHIAIYPFTEDLDIEYQFLCSEEGDEPFATDIYIVKHNTDYATEGVQNCDTDNLIEEIGYLYDVVTAEEVE